ncbi:MAG TPA: hypothetical protein VFH09_02955 [Nitrososphaera sp.]|nr:hypothetical protein [Nitrososphaera sp.]
MSPFFLPLKTSSLPVGTEDQEFVSPPNWKIPAQRCETARPAHRANELKLSRQLLARFNIEQNKEGPCIKVCNHDYAIEQL